MTTATWAIRVLPDEPVDRHEEPPRWEADRFGDISAKLPLHGAAPASIVVSVESWRTLCDDCGQTPTSGNLWIDCYHTSGWNCGNFSDHPEKFHAAVSSNRIDRPGREHELFTASWNEVKEFWKRWNRAFEDQDTDVRGP